MCRLPSCVVGRHPSSTCRCLACVQAGTALVWTGTRALPRGAATTASCCWTILATLRRYLCAEHPAACAGSRAGRCTHQGVMHVVCRMQQPSAPRAGVPAHGAHAHTARSTAVTNQRPIAGQQAHRRPRPSNPMRAFLLTSPPVARAVQVVIKALTVVVPSVDETHARNCYETSKSLGMAIVTSCLKEHAEHYRQQLFQYRLRTSIEPDGTVA